MNDNFADPAWQEVLDTPVTVNGRAMRLGACTVADLEWLIEARKAEAAAHAAQAEQLRALWMAER